MAKLAVVVTGSHRTGPTARTNMRGASVLAPTPGSLAAFPAAIGTLANVAGFRRAVHGSERADRRPQSFHCLAHCTSFIVMRRAIAGASAAARWIEKRSV